MLSNEVLYESGHEVLSFDVIADDKGRAEFKFADKLVKVTDIIGRSIVVAERSDDLGKGNLPMSKVSMMTVVKFHSV